jgi:uncharacterized protein
MFLDLQKVPSEGQKVDRVVDGEKLSIDTSDFTLRGPVTLTGRLQRDGEDEYRLDGTLTAEVALSCVRCLDEFTTPVDEALELLFLPFSRNVAPEGEPERGLDEEEMAVSFYRDDRIDISQLVLEQVLLALPMKPLCTPECAGLCPACGTNRNQEQCNCSPDSTDPRWEGLKSLLG